MPTRAEIQAWVARRAREDERLYERYGRPLDPDHRGEFVAISDDGRIIIGPFHGEATALVDTGFDGHLA